MPAQKNPAELGPAMLIAALYALILFVLAAARRYLGHDALYLVSVVAGLTDVDAIVLSVTRFAAEGSLPEVLGWRLIVTAVLSNAIFKLTLAASLGGREVLLRTLVLLAPSLVIGIGMVVAWPD